MTVLVDILGVILLLLVAGALLRWASPKNTFSETTVYECPEKHYKTYYDENPYCSKCGKLLTEKYEDPPVPENIRVKIAERVTPDSTEIVTEQERKESYHEVLESESSNEELETEGGRI